MSTEYSLLSTTFQILAIHHESMRQDVANALEEYAEDVDFEVESEIDDRLVMSVYFGGEVGDSFPCRIEQMAAVMGEYLIEPTRLTLREETMSDERDQVFWAGPTPQSIELARVLDHLTQAANELQQALPNGQDNTSPALRAASEAVMNLHMATEAIQAEQKQLLVQIKSDQVLSQANTEHITEWGQLSLPQDTELAPSSGGHILIAAALRDDGETADVLGSLNLEVLQTGGPKSPAAQISQTMQRFVLFHEDADVFMFVEQVCDVLELENNSQQTNQTDLPG